MKKNFDLINKAKEFNFAITDNTTYAGKDAVDKFYSTALLSAPSIDYVTLVPNVKSSIKLAKFNLGNIIQDEGTTWNATGEGTLSQKTFTVCPLKVNLEYFRSTFEQNFMNEYMRPGMSEEVMPSSFQEYIVDLIARQTADNLEQIFWAGNTTGATYPENSCNGIEWHLSGDSDVIDVSYQSSGQTAALIVTEMLRVYAQIPDTIIDKDDLYWFVSTSTMKLFKQAVASQNYLAYYQDTGELNFLGIKVVEAKGMTSGRMVVAQKSNLLWLTDLLSDADDVVVLPQRNISGIPSIRIAANFKFGAGYLYGTEIVFYA